MTRIARAGLLGDVEKGERGRDLARPDGDDEEVAAADRRRGHVADHRDGAAEMEEAHGEAHDLQALAPAAEDDHGAGVGDHADRRVDRLVVDLVEDAAEFGEGALVEIGHDWSKAPARIIVQGRAAAVRARRTRRDGGSWDKAAAGHRCAARRLACVLEAEIGELVDAVLVDRDQRVDDDVGAVGMDHAEALDGGAVGDHLAVRPACRRCGRRPGRLPSGST